MGDIQQQLLMVDVLQEEDTPLATPTGDGSSSTDPLSDEESNGMRGAQLSDDILGPILRLKEADQQPGEAPIAGMRHEARQLLQQWEQLTVQDRILYQKVEDQDGQNYLLSLAHKKSLSYRRYMVVV